MNAKDDTLVILMVKWMKLIANKLQEFKFKFYDKGITKVITIHIT